MRSYKEIRRWICLDILSSKQIQKEAIKIETEELNVQALSHRDR